MPFQVPVVGDEVTVYRPNEYPEITVVPEWVIVAYNNRLRRLAGTFFAQQAHWHTQIYQNIVTHKVQLAAGGTTDIVAPSWIRLNAGAALYFYGTQAYFNCTGASMQYVRFTDFTHVMTSPPGSNYSMYADNFVQWSMKAVKANILSISDPISKVKSLKPRTYTQAGKTRYGFIYEESPEAVREFAINEKGEEEGGVAIPGCVSINTAAIQELEKRVVELERQLKEVRG